MRQQEGWDDHAAFMDGLVEDGFLLLGGPLGPPPDGDIETLHVVDAESEVEIRTRFAFDPWASNGMLSVAGIEPWTVLLDGLNLKSRRT
jgi:uncharacterized protein